MTEDPAMQEWVVPALGIAVSPLPAAAMLLLLGGERVLARGTAFWGAWVAGIAAPTVAFVLLAERLDESDEAITAIAAGEIAVGAALVALALRQGLGAAADSGPPRWLQALDGAGAGRVAALAVLLSALNPKNLALVLSGALALAELDAAGTAALGFVLVAVSTISGLLAWRLLAPGRSAGPLAALRGIVARRGRTVGLVLGVLIGAYFAVDGLRRL
jgi:hypothetical protein